MKKQLKKKDVRVWTGRLLQYRFKLYITVNRQINLPLPYEIFSIILGKIKGY